jgi:hypothetical protein
MLAGCETERVLFTGPYHVRFTESADFRKESSTETLQISVHHAGPAKSEDIVIHYTLSGNAREGVDYVITGETSGTVTIKAGEYFSNIEFRLINNANNILRSQDIIFTLDQVSSNDLQIGQGQSAIGKTYTFTIFDDCILSGNYLGQNTINSASGPVTISSQDCEEYILSNWNINVFTTSQIMDLKFIDNGDNTLTIPQQEEENLGEEQATISGTGIVNPINGELLMTIKLEDFENQPEATLTFKRN